MIPIQQLILTLAPIIPMAILYSYIHFDLKRDTIKNQYKYIQKDLEDLRDNMINGFNKIDIQLDNVKDQIDIQYKDICEL